MGFFDKVRASFARFMSGRYGADQLSMALVIAALQTPEETLIHDIYHIQRGYQDIAGDLLVYRFEGIDLLDYPKIVASVTFEDVCTLLRDAFGENDFVLSTVLPLDKNA